MPKVLVVDDEPDVLLLLQINLNAAGIETALAADGDVALQRLRQEPFDLVLLDILMPVLDGWGVLEALRGDARSPKVIVLSAHPSESNIARALELGAAKYIAKGSSFDEIVPAVKAILANGRPRDEPTASGAVPDVP